MFTHSLMHLFLKHHQQQHEICFVQATLVHQSNRLTHVTYVLLINNNKFAHSNLGRGPRRGAVAHVRRKVPIGYNGAPQICPQKYPFTWADPQTPIPASSLDPSDLRCQTASRSDPPFLHNALDRPTDITTDRATDRSFTGKFDDYSL